MSKMILKRFRISGPWFHSFGHCLSNQTIKMPGIEDQLFNLKFTSKQLVRQSKKMEKDAEKEKLKIKKVGVPTPMLGVCSKLGCM